MAVVLEKRHVYVGDCTLQVQLRGQVSELVAEDDGGMSGTKLCLYLVGKRAAKLGGVGGRALVCLAGVGEMATASRLWQPELQAPCGGLAHCPGRLPACRSPSSRKKRSVRFSPKETGGIHVLYVHPYITEGERRRPVQPMLAHKWDRRGVEGRKCRVSYIRL